MKKKSRKPAPRRKKVAARRSRAIKLPLTDLVLKMQRDQTLREAYLKNPRAIAKEAGLSADKAKALASFNSHILISAMDLECEEAGLCAISSVLHPNPTWSGPLGGEGGLP
jgi:hypothetical protein